MNVDELLSKMSVEEKLAEMSQFNMACVFSTGAEITGPAANLGLTKTEVNSTGSVLNFSNAEEMIATQSLHLKDNPNNIPLLFMQDVIHGFRTIYPIPLAMGATFDTELMEKCCAMAAKEAAVGGVNVTFGPMVDLVRDARWGRCMESTGEDPYLNCLMAKAQVKGFREGNSDKKYNIAACVKHYAAYGAAEAGRDYNTTDMCDHTLREYYLPSYKAAIDAGVDMLMTSFNLLNGVPAAANKYLINDILRDEWNFDKTVITDYHSFLEMINHGYCADFDECARAAFKCETDIEMMSTCYVKSGKKLLDSGEITMERIDRSVRRILELKQSLGMFDNPYAAASTEEGDSLYLSSENRELCRIAAEKSAVLLKNDSVLPLSESIEKIAVIGPFAKSGMIGFWSCHGRDHEAVSVYRGIADMIGEDKLIYAEGCSSAVRAKPDRALIEEAKRIAASTDAAILCMGEYREMSGEGNSMVDISLSEAQKALIREVASVNKNTVVLLFNGRPLALGDIIDDAPSFFTLWQPGTEGGSAAANLIFGRSDFEGRLTMSFPYHSGQCPIYYNRMMTGRPKPAEGKHFAYVSNYLDYPNHPLFAFGYGLSYTKFDISSPTLSASSMTPAGKITASVKVKNVGKRGGVSNIQLYIRDVAASVARPIKELRGYKKVSLSAGEEKEVCFDICDDMLKFNTASGVYESEAGKFEVFISDNAEKGTPVSFILEK